MACALAGLIVLMLSEPRSQVRTQRHGDTDFQQSSSVSPGNTGAAAACVFRSAGSVNSTIVPSLETNRVVRGSSLPLRDSRATCTLTTGGKSLMVVEPLSRSAKGRRFPARKLMLFPFLLNSPCTEFRVKSCIMNFVLCYRIIPSSIPEQRDCHAPVVSDAVFDRVDVLFAVEQRFP
jgi:hypothetical protein